MTGLFAASLVVSLALAGAISFSTEKGRPRLKWLLILSLLLTWAALGLSVEQIVTRTAATLVTPGGPRQPHLADPATREIPAMAVTASAMTHDRQKIMAAGFDAYQTKPLNVREFVEAVRGILAARRSAPP